MLERERGEVSKCMVGFHAHDIYTAARIQQGLLRSRVARVSAFLLVVVVVVLAR